MAPRARLTALWWRVLGKRVRTRGQFAPLLAASPRAYRLWLLTEPSLSVHGEGGQAHAEHRSGHSQLELHVGDELLVRRIENRDRGPFS